jgi:hypothetical protein
MAASTTDDDCVRDDAIQDRSEAVESPLGQYVSMLIDDGCVRKLDRNVSIDDAHLSRDIPSCSPS